MIYLSRLVGAIVLLVMATGCTTAYSPEITQEHRDNLSSLHTVLFTPQEEINGQFVPSNQQVVMAAQAGLIGSLVGSGMDALENAKRARAAEDAVEPIRNLLLEFDFRREAEEIYGQRLRNINWMSLEEFESDYAHEEYKVEKYLATIDEDALLVLVQDYSVTPRLDAVQVGLSAALYRRSSLPATPESERTAIEPITEVYVQYQSDSVNPLWQVKDPDQLAKEIAELESDYDKRIAEARNSSKRGLEIKKKEKVKKLRKSTSKIEVPLEETPPWEKEQLIAVLREGIQQTAMLAARHFNDDLSEADYEERKTTVGVVNSHGILRSSNTAYELESAPGRRVFRLTDGSLYSIPNGQPIREPAPIK